MTGKQAMDFKPQVGDVFLIPLDGRSAAGGQVIAIRDDEELYIAVFDQRLNRNETDPAVAVDGVPILLTLSFDAKLFHGDWPIIGNLLGLVNRYPEPSYKVKHAGVMSLESRDHLVRRPASPEELEVLKYRSVAAPQNIEDAINAHFGIGEWSAHYDKYCAEYAIASSKLL
jgi:hypothetical protein